MSVENGLAGFSPRLAVNASGQSAASWLQQRDDAAGNLAWVGMNFV